MINGLSIIQQEEILADLNSLGRYQRIRPGFRGEPVEISAYIVNTGADDDPPCSSSGAGTERIILLINIEVYV